jgi:UDP-2-acetamido-3-amino-2,3-dideoxy-glucuronate N-acetyltransferase
MSRRTIRIVGNEPTSAELVDLASALGFRLCEDSEAAAITAVLVGADGAGSAIDRAIDERSAILAWEPIAFSDVAAEARRARAKTRGVPFVVASPHLHELEQIADFVAGNAPPSRDYFAHHTATIDPGAIIGAGTKIWHYAHISSNSVIGERCSFGQNTFVAPSVRVGNNVKVQNNVSLYEGVICEDDVFLGPSCVLTNVMNPRSHVSRRNEYRTTLLRRGATVGANATIVCGSQLGQYAFVGAGAVVTRDVPAFAQVVGTPARVIAYRCQCGERLSGATLPPLGALRCDTCGSTYTVLESGELHWNEA